MSVFDHYAKYYELLYREKDYNGEAAFVHDRIQKARPGSKNVIELGCGTGKHAHCLVEHGYSVHGLDLSAGMVEQAIGRKDGLSKEIGGKLNFSVGDIREARLNRKFDAAISLFHVISYQTTNDDLFRAFETARAHLEPGGLFLFDVWYGPAVLTTPPETRVKRLSDETIEVTRVAESDLHPNENLVDVNYHVFVRNKKDDSVREVKETHRMRYLFKPELELIFDRTGFELLATGEFLTGRDASRDTWGVYFVVRALA